VRRELLYDQISEDYGVSRDALVQLEPDAGRNRTPSRQQEEQDSIPGAALEAQRNILRTVLAFPELFAKTYERLNPDLLTDSAVQTVFCECIKQFERDGVLVPDTLFSELEDPQQASLVSMFIHETDSLDAPTAAALNDQSIIFLLKKDYERRIRELKEQYARAADRGDTEKADKFYTLCTIIQRQKHALGR
jgi:replicative DNA helicase